MPCLHKPWTRSPAVKYFIDPTRPRVNYFSSTASCAAAAAAESRKTHYDILGVPVTATAQEIKKKFYALSLAHHPDRNRTDPDASAKFAAISSAYHVLSNATKRARYDHDHNIHRPVVPSGTHTSSTHRGSYVGSRPPSGLSKRRGPFRGPPPSFYAHGSYGSHAHREAPNPQYKTHDHPSASASSSTYSSPAEDPASFVYRNEVPHFNATSHFRTQSHEDARRKLRRAKAAEDAKKRAQEEGVGGLDGFDSTSSGFRFLVISGALGAGMILASLGTGITPPTRPPRVKGIREKEKEKEKEKEPN